MLQITVTGLSAGKVIVQDPHPADGAWRMEVGKDQTKVQKLTTGQLSRMDEMLQAFQTKGLIKYEISGEGIERVHKSITPPPADGDTQPGEAVDVVKLAQEAAVTAVTEVIDAFKASLPTAGMVEENLQTLTTVVATVAEIKATVENPLDLAYKTKKGEDAWGDKPPKTYKEAIHRLVKMFE